MKKTIALIVAACFLASIPLAIAKDPPKKEEKKKNGWYYNVDQFIKGLQGAGKWVGDLFAGFTSPPNADKNKSGKDLKKNLKKADKNLKKTDQKVKKKVTKAGKDLKKAVKKIGQNLSH